MPVLSLDTNENIINAKRYNSDVSSDSDRRSPTRISPTQRGFQFSGRAYSPDEYNSPERKSRSSLDKVRRLSLIAIEDAAYICRKAQKKFVKSANFGIFFAVSLSLAVLEAILVGISNSGVWLDIQGVILAGSTFLFFGGLFMIYFNITDVTLQEKLFHALSSEVIVEAVCLSWGWAFLFIYPGVAALRCFRVFRLLWYFGHRPSRHALGYRPEDHWASLRQTSRLCVSYLRRLGHELFTAKSRGGLVIIGLFLYTAYLFAVVFSNTESLLVTSAGHVCEELTSCFFTMLRLSFYEGLGFDFLEAVVFDGSWGLALLLFLYMLFTAIVLLNGLIGIFGQVFDPTDNPVVAEDQADTRTESDKLRGQLHSVRDLRRNSYDVDSRRQTSVGRIRRTSTTDTRINSQITGNDVDTEGRKKRSLSQVANYRLIELVENHRVRFPDGNSVKGDFRERFLRSQSVSRVDSMKAAEALQALTSDSSRNSDSDSPNISKTKKAVKDSDSNELQSSNSLNTIRSPSPQLNTQSSKSDLIQRRQSDPNEFHESLLQTVKPAFHIRTQNMSHPHTLQSPLLPIRPLPFANEPSVTNNHGSSRGRGGGNGDALNAISSANVNASTSRHRPIASSTHMFGLSPQSSSKSTHDMAQNVNLIGGSDWTSKLPSDMLTSMMNKDGSLGHYEPRSNPDGPSGSAHVEMTTSVEELLILARSLRQLAESVEQRYRHASSSERNDPGLNSSRI